MSRRELVSELDRRTFARMQEMSLNQEKRGIPLTEKDLTDLIRFLRRRRWTWKLIGQALRISPRKASRLHRAWQDEHYPLD